MIWDRWRKGLERTREALGARLRGVGRGAQREEVLDAVEEALLTADCGLTVAGGVRRALERRAPDDMPQAFQEAMLRIAGPAEPLRWAEEGPTVWVLVGVNGAGKTTTVGKLAMMAKGLGRSVVIAAADTYRAAATDQVAVWAERAGAEIVRGAERQDPASVAFQAIERAKAKGAGLVLVDTAGRLHNRQGLLDELGKLVRATGRALYGAPHEVLLVVDGATGQNAVAQAQGFMGAAPLTGVCVTKLDGAAKGGSLLAVREALSLPVKLVGLGEGIEDLVAFSPEEYVQAIAPNWAEIGSGS
ncbi:MAG: signal recognition particle-docking protein FtsY [Thermaerobacter sp.]|nr:signal recognition particle-docking protein FtsY [Thermaerobacter sp.]